MRLSSERQYQGPKCPNSPSPSCGVSLYGPNGACGGSSYGPNGACGGSSYGPNGACGVSLYGPNGACGVSSYGPRPVNPVLLEPELVVVWPADVPPSVAASPMVISPRDLVHYWLDRPHRVESACFRQGALFNGCTPWPRDPRSDSMGSRLVGVTLGPTFPSRDQTPLPDLYYWCPQIGQGSCSNPLCPSPWVMRRWLQLPRRT